MISLDLPFYFIDILPKQQTTVRPSQPALVNFRRTTSTCLKGAKFIIVYIEALKRGDFIQCGFLVILNDVKLSE